jgi:hypothetical protein
MRISNEFPGLFRPDKIIINQDSEDYEAENDYHFRVTPTNPIP